MKSCLKTGLVLTGVILAVLVILALILPTTNGRNASVDTGLLRSDLAHLDDAVPLLKDVDKNLVAISKLGSEPKVNDMAWKTEIATLAAKIAVSHEALSEIEPPKIMEDIHATILAASYNCTSGASKLNDYASTLDTEELKRSGVLLKACSNSISEAVDMINAITKPDQPAQ